MKCILGLHIHFLRYLHFILHGGFRFPETLCQQEIWDEFLLSAPIDVVFMFENLHGNMGLL